MIRKEKIMKLFKVEFKGMYGEDVYTTAKDYSDAASKALEIKFNEQIEKTIFDEDGNLKKEKEIKVQRVELLTENIHL